MKQRRPILTKKNLCKRLLTCRVERFNAPITGVRIVNTHLADMDLRGVRFVDVDFTGSCFVQSHLEGTVFQKCVLDNASFDYATLDGAFLEDCSLENTDFWRASMQEITIRGCFAENDRGIPRATRFNGCDLSNARLTANNIQRVDFTNTTITDALLQKNDFSNAVCIPPMVCPPEGSFIAYKKVINRNGKRIIAKLMIPEDAERSSATTRKCRASKAKVIGFYKLDGAHRPTNIRYAHSNYDWNFKYRVGETVVSEFDKDRWNECAPGIHFFMSLEEAAAYCL